ncbi:M20/M25/M40 family metallo-hydrolase [Microbacterium sp. MAHUQ-60]|uniref:M20/M25/M40 family metallo-hydrolase n=1 Tax=unclassified Microbacterium TaxID=2609290 RepID=UPI00360AE1AB
MSKVGTTDQQVLESVAEMQPVAVERLKALVRIPSVSNGAHEDSLRASASLISGMLHDTGLFDTIEEIRPTTAGGDVGKPTIVATRAAKDGAPTVLMYSHHDVQPANDPEEWTTDPFDPVIIGGRLHGRGSADDKAGFIVQLGALDSLRQQTAGNPSLGIFMLVEGEEEIGSPTFERLLELVGDKIEADAIIITDSENWDSSTPALVRSLRGQANFDVSISTLEHGLHSGISGGVFPDAMVPMARLLASFHHADGSVAVRGLDDGPEETEAIDGSVLRSEQGVLPGVTEIGTGTFAERLWAKPTVTVTGLSLPHPESAVSMLVPRVIARVSVRLAPDQDADKALAALRAHIAEHTPFGAHVEFTPRGVTRGVMATKDGGLRDTMKRSLTDGWGAPVVESGTGGSASLVSLLATRYPDAHILLTGVLDPLSRAHSPNESVSLDILHKAMAAHALFLVRLERSR